MTTNKSPGKLGRGPDAPTNVAPQIIRTRDELAGRDPKAEERREPPPYVLHRSIGLWQPPPATWKEE